ncbi:hypothetical protein CcaverHIS002_0500040 [Cutaneotrichosporon cavernicola]|nr:hypothetical protein CcaverHIS002_0500040 [Cutaneotrichosporon cavernicola]
MDSQCLKQLACNLAGAALFLAYEGTLSPFEQDFLLLHKDGPQPFPSHVDKSPQEAANSNWPLIRQLGSNNMTGTIFTYTTGQVQPGTVVQHATNGKTISLTVPNNKVALLGLLACNRCRQNWIKVSSNQKVSLCLVTIPEDQDITRIKCHTCATKTCNLNPGYLTHWWLTKATLLWEFGLWVTGDGSRPTSPEAKDFFSYFKNLVGHTPHLILSQPTLPPGASQTFKAAYQAWFNKEFLQGNPRDSPIKPKIPGVYNYPFSWSSAPHN